MRGGAKRERETGREVEREGEFQDMGEISSLGK